MLALVVSSAQVEEELAKARVQAMTVPIKTDFSGIACQAEAGLLPLFRQLQSSASQGATLQEAQPALQQLLQAEAMLALAWGRPGSAFSFLAGRS